MKPLFFALLLAIIASTALATEKQRTICSKEGQQRIIEVVYTGEGRVPCEVHYTKETGTQVLWRAQQEVGYCEEKAAAFIEKQQQWGWECAQEMEMPQETTE